MGEMFDSLYTFREPYPILPRHDGHVRVQAAIAEEYIGGLSSWRREYRDIGLLAVMLMNGVWYSVSQSTVLQIHRDQVASSVLCDRSTVRYPPL